MGVTILYCSSCCECLHEDCFEKCQNCYEFISDPDDGHGYLCTFHVNEDKEYEYVLNKKVVNLCYDCNPNFHEGEAKQEVLDFLAE